MLKLIYSVNRNILSCELFFKLLQYNLSTTHIIFYRDYCGYTFIIIKQQVTNTLNRFSDRRENARITSKGRTVDHRG